MTSTMKKLAAVAVMTAGVGAMTVATTTPAAAWYRGGGFRGGYGYHGYGFRGGYGPRFGYRYGYGPGVGLGVAAGALAAGAVAGAVASPYYYGRGYPGYYRGPYAYPYPYYGYGYGGY